MKVYGCGGTSLKEYTLFQTVRPRVVAQSEDVELLRRSMVMKRIRGVLNESQLHDLAVARMDLNINLRIFLCGITG